MYRFTGQRSAGWTAHTAQILIQAKKYFQGGRISRKDLGCLQTDSCAARFWEILPDDNFVARPPEVAKIKTFRPSHMNGMCVDVTLTNMDGTDIEMPSPFDTMNERAALSCKRNSAVGRKNASYLKEVMESVGFQAYKGEWWHFYDVTGEPVPFSDYDI